MSTKREQPACPEAPVERLVRCCSCAKHLVIPDPDPDDWFNDDDCAIVCTIVPNDKQICNSKYLADRSEFKQVSSSLRPYEASDVARPKWCPLSDI